MDPLLQIILVIVGLVLMLGAGAVRRLIAPGPGAQGSLPVAGGLAPANVKITWPDVIYALCMVLGILAKEIWDNINETQRVNIQVPRLVAALIVSPIIYAAVYSKLVEGELSLLGLAVAFQNGFFWQAVFRTAQGKQ